jgi:hypothetical protein
MASCPTIWGASYNFMTQYHKVLYEDVFQYPLISSKTVGLIPQYSTLNTQNN